MVGAHGPGDGWGAPKSEKARKTRARMRARYKLEKEGRVHKGDGKVVDHIRPLASGGAEDSSKNLRVRDAHSNNVSGGKLRHRIRK
jgi:hypothetical protein